MKSEKTKHVLQLVLVLFVGLSMGLCIRVGTRSNTTLGTTSNSDLSQFERVYETIEDEWLNTTDEDVDLETAAIEGFVNNLGDPHTTYFSQEALQDFTTAVDGSFAGIGVTFSVCDEGGKISSVLQETPASEAGLEAGDIIIKIDGTSIQGMTADEVKALVTGTEGTNVKVTVLREGKELNFDITRRKIDSSVTYEIREDKIGYLDINTFGTMTDQSIEKALKYFKENKIDTIVIDLRDNTGGYLSSVQNVLGLFLEKGTVLFSIQEKEGPATKYVSLNADNYVFSQGYILTNGNTASASEVMAGALSEQLNYVLVGKTTYGKGTAQTQVMLTNMTSIKYTYAKWLLPSGNCVNGVGLTPDIEIDELELNDFYSIDFEEIEPLSYDLVSMDVADMQLMLETIGYNPGRTDGYFDYATETALKAFEKDNELTVDGILDENDYSYLEQALVSHFSDLQNDACYQRILEEMR